MRRSRQLLLTGFILLGMGLIDVAQAADHSCADCHRSATPSADDLIQPLSGLCADCHVERIAAGEHVVDVDAHNPTTTLPLQAGKLTCITCHDPHQPLAALRLPDPALCRQCHPR
jgi:predicted CXXCH cytochrome family protein